MNTPNTKNFDPHTSTESRLSSSELQRRKSGRAALTLIATIVTGLTGVAAEGHHVRDGHDEVQKSRGITPVEHSLLNPGEFGADVMVGARALVDQAHGIDPLKDPFLVGRTKSTANIDPASLPDIPKQ